MAASEANTAPSGGLARRISQALTHRGGYGCKANELSTSKDDVADL